MPGLAAGRLNASLGPCRPVGEAWGVCEPMLRFLREIRRQLMNSGQTGRYLTYALGEIVLVVVGILIALQIDNWNDDRLDRKREQEYLSSMLIDLQEDVERIDQANEGNDFLLARIDELLELLARPPEDVSQLRQIFLHSVVYTYWYLRADFSELTMSQLRYSGDLQLIRDKAIRDAMLDYEQGVEACRHQYAELIQYFHTYEATQKRLLNYTLAKQAFEYLEEDYRNMLKPLAPFEALVPEGDYIVDDDPRLMAQYYGDILFYRTALNNTVWFLGEQKRMAIALARRIEDSTGPAAPGG